MDGLEIAVHCLFICLLWGGTNNLIKKSTTGITKIQSDNIIKNFVNEIKYLIANWRYVLLFLINQCGSVLYFFLLQRVDLSFIVPIVNALTFVVTGLVGTLTGEQIPNQRTLLGLLCIVTGITCCVLDKVNFGLGVK